MYWCSDENDDTVVPTLNWISGKNTTKSKVLIEGQSMRYSFVPTIANRTGLTGSYTMHQNVWMDAKSSTEHEDRWTIHIVVKLLSLEFYFSYVTVVTSPSLLMTSRYYDVVMTSEKPTASECFEKAARRRYLVLLSVAAIRASCPMQRKALES